MTKSVSTIATRIRAARTMKSLSTRALARAAGLSPGTISKIETQDASEHSVEVKTVLAIADALGINRAWLLTGEGAPELSTKEDEDERGSEVVSTT